MKRLFGGGCGTGVLQLENQSVLGSSPKVKTAFSKAGKQRTSGLKLEMKEGISCSKTVQ